MTLRETALRARSLRLLPNCGQPTHIVRVLGSAIRGTRTSDKKGVVTMPVAKKKKAKKAPAKKKAKKVAKKKRK